VARFLIGPLDVIKIRFQVQLEPIRNAQNAAAKQAASKYTGLGQALATILKEEGVQVSGVATSNKGQQL
jgi:solute carrier family 25 thiamine pyrophosphate transporter 19